METKHNYESAVLALEELKQNGYTEDYNIAFEDLERNVDDFQIDYLYKYEGMTNPGDDNSIYGLSNATNGKKGVFVTGNLSFVEGRKQKIIMKLDKKTRNI
jgi:hypothetical protein